MLLSYILFLPRSILLQMGMEGRVAFWKNGSLLEILGMTVWRIPTEKFYYNNRKAYYEWLNVGVNYYESLENLSKILSFLTLLPGAVRYNPVDWTDLHTHLTGWENPVYKFFLFQFIKNITLLKN